MRFAIDVDGVVTEAPLFFAALTQALRAAGHTVFVVSDFDEHFRAQREADLERWGIGYDEFAITADKAGFCRQRQVDFALDDDAPHYFPGEGISHLGLVALTWSGEEAAT